MRAQGKPRTYSRSENRRLFDLAHELFWLNEATGDLIYRLDRGNKRAGDVAGYARQFVSGSSGTVNTYVYCVLDGRKELAHRIVWLLKNGSFPPPGLVIDHINNDSLDNRPNNLRLLSFSENTANAKLSRRNSSGFRGVSRAGKKWRAAIGINGRTKYLGVFENILDAANAYNRAAMRVWGQEVYSVYG